MRPSGTITLFSERPQSSRRPAPVLLSVVVHGAAVAVVATGLLVRPRIIDRGVAERYTVRRLDLHQPPPQMRRDEGDEALYPLPAPAPGAALAAKHESAPSPAPRPEIARQVAQTTPTPQTLLQPKLPPHVLPDKIPIPTVVIWSMESKTPPIIVPPVPHKVAPARVQPSVNPPNEEVNLSDLGISSSELASKTQPILPSTTSPLVVLSQQPAQAVPQTSSTGSAQPTPTAVVSLSEIRKDGFVALPQANQTASAKSSGTVAAGRPEDLANTDRNGTADKPGTAANANATGSGVSGDAAKNANTPGAKLGATEQTSAATGVGTAAVTGAGSFANVDRIVLPKDGQFGVVVVGSSLEEMYPETAELWAGRLAYTVYLHVGLSKSWILQYSLPANADAAAAGTTQLTAPWPYTIIRPNIAPGAINADALMVHGFVNAAGRFETLAVAFPPQFAQAEFVLNSLRQWEFRPAMHAGKPATVEVLLIIPEIEE
jgi:hypothetical protein